MPANTIELIISAKDTASTVLDKLKSTLLKINPAFVAIGTAAATVTGILIKLTKETADAGDEIYKASKKIGITTEKLSGLKYAAELSNVSFEELTSSLGLFSKKINDVINGSDEASKTFKELGIDVYDSNNILKSTDNILNEVANRFKNLENGAEKTALSMQLFGRSGKDLIPLLNQGEEGLKKLHEEAKKAGVVFSYDAAKGAEQFNDNITQMKANLSGLAFSIGNSIIPKVNQLFDTLIDRSQEINRELGSWEKSVLKEMGLIVKDATKLAELTEALPASQLKVTKEVKKETETVIKLKEEWLKVRAVLQLDVSKIGLDTLGQKIVEIKDKAREFIEKFKDIPSAKKDIENWTNSLIKAVTTEEELGLALEQNKNNADIMYQALLGHTQKMTEEAEKIKPIYQEFYDETGHLSAEYYTSRIKEIESIAALWKDKGIEAVEVEKWKINRIKDLTIEKNEIMLESTNSLTEAMSLSWENYTLRAESAIQTIAQATTIAWEGVQQGFGNAIGRMIVYGEDFGASFKKVLESVLAAFISIIAQMIARWVMFTILTGGFGAGAGVLKIFGFSKGGVVEGGLQPIQSAANGGVFTAPTLAMIGDNPDRQEAVIPMRGGKVPVEFINNRENNAGGQIYIRELSIMQGASIDEALTSKPMDFWLNLVKEKILPALNELGSNGATTNLRFREAY